MISPLEDFEPLRLDCLYDRSKRGHQDVRQLEPLHVAEDLAMSFKELNKLLIGSDVDIYEGYWRLRGLIFV